MYQYVKNLAPSFIRDFLDLGLKRRLARLDPQRLLLISCCSLSQIKDSSIKYSRTRLWNKIRYVKLIYIY